MPRYFTLEEANLTLETIRPLMEEIQKIRQNVLATQPETWSVIERSARNGGNPAMSKLVKSFDWLDDLLHRIQKTGVQVKDINTGLLDFPALRAGHEVCLCWQIGERQIEYWHEIDAGFAGRQPIETF